MSLRAHQISRPAAAAPRLPHDRRLVAENSAGCAQPLDLAPVPDRTRNAEDLAAIRNVVGALTALVGGGGLLAAIVGASVEAKFALGSMSLVGLAVVVMLSVLELQARAHAPSPAEPSMADLSEEGRDGSADAASQASRAAAGDVLRRDVFISHASEDKEAIARPLAEQLRARDCSVWFDDYELVLGDSLRTKIGDGLRHSRVGVVILSRNFFAKRWPRWELDGLTARQLAGEQNVILPVLHEVGPDDVRSYSLPLADLVAATVRRPSPMLLCAC